MKNSVFIKVIVLVLLCAILFLCVFLSPTQEEHRTYYCKKCASQAEEIKISKLFFPYYSDFRIKEPDGTKIGNKFKELFGAMCNHEFVLCGVSGQYGKSNYDGYGDGQKWALRFISIMRLFEIYTGKIDNVKSQKIYSLIEIIGPISITAKTNKIIELEQFKEIRKKLMNLKTLEELEKFVENELSCFPNHR